MATMMPRQVDRGLLHLDTGTVSIGFDDEKSMVETSWNHSFDPQNVGVKAGAPVNVRWNQR